MRYIPPEEDEQVVVEAKKEYRYKPKGGCIYVIHCVGFPYYKIGQSIDPQSRLDNLQIGVPFDLELCYVVVVQDMNEVEYKVQQSHKDKHIRGEWYMFTDEELEFIKSEIIALKDYAYSGETYPAYLRVHPRTAVRIVMRRAEQATC